MISSYSGEYQAKLYNTAAKLIANKKGAGILDFDGIHSSGIYLLSIIRDNKLLGTKKIIIK